MKALLSKAPGGPETLVLEDRPDPKPGPGQVVIAIKACGVNFPDLLIIKDLYQFKPERPFSPGGEVSGMVGGVGAVVDHAVQAGKFAFWPAPHAADAIAFLAALVTMMFGSIPQQDVYQRVMSAKSENIAVAGSVMGGSFYFLFAFVPLTIAVLDDGGALASRGKDHQDYVSAYFRHNFFALPVPKSLDRNAFDLSLIGPLSPEDGAATLTAFTAASIAKSREYLPEEPRLWVVAGGGRRNRTLMGMLAGHVNNAVVPAEALGFDGDAIEAEAWAYLAVRSLDGLPITYPGTTGAPSPVTGGVVSRA